MTLFMQNRYRRVYDMISEPVLEESLYWRGKACYMAAKTDHAAKDYRAALKVHPKWIPPRKHFRIWVYNCN